MFGLAGTDHWVPSHISVSVAVVGLVPPLVLSPTAKQNRGLEHETDVSALFSTADLGDTAHSLPFHTSVSVADVGCCCPGPPTAMQNRVAGHETAVKNPVRSV